MCYVCYPYDDLESYPRLTADTLKELAIKLHISYGSLRNRIFEETIIAGFIIFKVAKNGKLLQCNKFPKSVLGGR